MEASKWGIWGFQGGKFFSKKLPCAAKISGKENSALADFCFVQFVVVLTPGLFHMMGTVGSVSREL